jgi:ureidoglycolate lyase
MPDLNPMPLSLEAFAPYGHYANMLEPSGPAISAEGLFCFYRDMVRLDLGRSTLASFSVCEVNKRKLLVDALEYHSACGEAMMPLDADVLMQLAPAGPKLEPPLEAVEVFRIPKGVMVILHPGVWHHAPFVVGADKVNILVGLPERAYANDAVVVEIDPARRLRISCGE